MPAEIRGGWNWGAFLLNWIWGLGNRVYIALLCLIPLVNWLMIFVLAVKGNEWAWQHRQWDSVEHFRRTQRTWAYWGAGIWGVFISLAIIGVVVSTLTDSQRDLVETGTCATMVENSSPFDFSEPALVELPCSDPRANLKGVHAESFTECPSGFEVYTEERGGVICWVHR